MPRENNELYDVVVVGAGNAALCAALSAEENGARVVMLEWAPKELSGGNSRFTEGAVRFSYQNVDDVRSVVPDISESEIAMSDFGTYPASQFYDDLCTTTNYRADADLLEVITQESKDVVRWMGRNGVRFLPAFGQESVKIGDKHYFPSGEIVKASGGGPGLVDALTARAEKRGVEIRYGVRATGLLMDAKGVCGVRVRIDSREEEVRGRTVILACGGFESNPEWRARYLGPGWELAKVRGTRYNMGDGIKMALDVGAVPHGHWSGCHAVAWDLNAPTYGDLKVGTDFQKHGYLFGIMLNANGQRFFDEGEDFFHYTYAKCGNAILQQPGQYAYQIFDKKAAPYLRNEYRIKQMTRFTADTIEGLVDKLDLDKTAAVQTIRAFNEAQRAPRSYDPSVKDGYGTIGITPAKSNWASPIDTPPFDAYAVTCGITFTYGGLRITPLGEVLSADDKPIPGLYAAGELVGGLYYFNYTSSVGLLAGAIFGRRAGRAAASLAANDA